MGGDMMLRIGEAGGGKGGTANDGSKDLVMLRDGRRVGGANVAMPLLWRLGRHCFKHKRSLLEKISWR
jgi:hypothetical protein